MWSLPIGLVRDSHRRWSRSVFAISKSLTGPHIELDAGNLKTIRWTMSSACKRPRQAPAVLHDRGRAKWSGVSSSSSIDTAENADLSMRLLGVFVQAERSAAPKLWRLSVQLKEVRLLHHWIDFAKNPEPDSSGTPSEDQPLFWNQEWAFKKKGLLSVRTYQKST